MMTEDMFFESAPGAFKLYEHLREELLWRYPETEIKVQKTQISFYDVHMYACVSFSRVRRKADLPDPYLTVTFGLPGPVDDPRIAVSSEIRPGRWTLHVVIGSIQDIDAQLLSWIDESHRLSCSK